MNNNFHNNNNFNMFNGFNNQNNIINNMNQINMMNMKINQINMINNQINQINNFNAFNLINDRMNILNNQLNERNNQMKQMNNNKIIKEFPDIKEEQKILTLIRKDNSKKIISIPISLKKNELYLIANKYKINRFSKIYLYKNDSILKDDESNINDIKNGEEIYIIEQLNVDETYYKNYLKKHNNRKLLNIIFDYKALGTKKILKIFPHSRIKTMIKLFLYEMKIPEENKNDFSFLFNGFKLDTNDNLTLYEKGMNSNSIILVTKNDELTINNNLKGKILKVNVEYKNEIISRYSIGTLNKIKDLFTMMEIDLGYKNIFIKEIKINKKKYERNDERTFSSIGIMENFTCQIVALNINGEKNCIIF